jgi:DNA-binding Lrp family transcriptional regulator
MPKHSPKWRSNAEHINSRLKQLPRRLRKDAEDLVRIFFWRKSKKLRLADNYLVKLWECSRATVQRRLEALEKWGIIRRFTLPPQKRNGKFSQLRYLFLVTAKKVKSSLVSQKETPDNKGGTPLNDSSTPEGGKREPKMGFADYLSLRDDVPLASFMFWMRRWKANPQSMGYLRKIWEMVKNRADILEGICWDADEAGLRN